VLDGTGGAGRLPGGYEAWEADRRARRTSGTLRVKATSTPMPTPPAGPAARGAAPASSAGGPSLGSLRNRVRQIEKEMTPLDRRRGRLEAQLAALADHREIATVGAELATVVEAIGALEEQWLELSAQIEERS
jgi:hypothetical protein